VDKRKQIRLPHYDYSSAGCYFVTVCTADKAPVLCDIVGHALPGVPVELRLSEYGETAEKQLLKMADFYDGIRLDKYVIMPNHIHLLLCYRGTPGTACPTVGQFIGTFKRFTKSIPWQKRFYDHVIRDEADYRTKWQYIDNNPARWAEDKENPDA